MFTDMYALSNNDMDMLVKYFNTRQALKKREQYVAPKMTDADIAMWFFFHVFFLCVL